VLPPGLTDFVEHAAGPADELGHEAATDLQKTRGVGVDFAGVLSVFRAERL